ncbi:MAG: DUF1501 domain-containing protein [Planctomycetota bacterium]|nr:DUF1501 domain-containing protein [Planctomycetota bacterium]
MIDFGSFQSRSCRGNSRRAFLRTAAAAPFAVGLGLPSSEAIAKVREQAKAKSVILLWLWGGPSHIDLVDPKPDAPMDYRGPFGTIPTKTPGMRFTEILPRMAARSDRYSVVRSMVNSRNGHPDAGTVGVTGFEESPGPVQPNFGSIVAKHHSSSGSLPPFFYVGKGIPRDLPRRIEGYGGGTLGKAWDPFLVNCSERGDVSIPTLKLLPKLNANRITDRRQLLRELDDERHRLDAVGIDEWGRAYQSAYGLLTSPQARGAFDLTQESKKTRAGYGRTTFGQGCLLARRLAEAGVPYIQVNWSEYVETFTPNGDWGWDTHIYNFELLQDRHGPIFDRAFSALLDDLNDRGMMQDTLLVAMGEFGRTPKISNRAAREHWNRCYFSIWAGAGIEEGRCIGESDAKAEFPVTRPINPLMAGTTIAELCGVGAQQRAEMKVLDGGSLIDELL